MKITKQYLKQIIKEEMGRINPQITHVDPKHQSGVPGLELKRVEYFPPDKSSLVSVVYNGKHRSVVINSLLPNKSSASKELMDMADPETIKKIITACREYAETITKS